MTPPTQFRFLLGLLNGIISEMTTGNAQNPIFDSVYQPDRFRYLVGGVMTPPYAGLLNHNTADELIGTISSMLIGLTQQIVV